jgi:hypothetical protein
MIGVLVRIAAAAAGALAGAAVARELDKPAQDRQWHGEIAGVPYDFRPPTVDKVRRSAWDPDNPKTVVPQAFGVGWSVNLARLAKFVQPPQAPAPTPAAPLPAAPVPAPLPAAESPAIEAPPKETTSD